MIQLTCSNCQTVLEIDDGFAGGVCRCAHCGTIQTVPALVKTKAPGKPPAAQVVSKPKVLYQRPTTPKDGLDELAAAAETATTMVDAPRYPKRAPARPAGNSMAPILVVGGLTVVLLIALFVYLSRRGHGPAAGGPGSVPQSVSPGQAGGSATPGVASSGEAAFMGIALKGPSVIYLLDRGQGTTADTFDALRGATAQSIGSLGKGRKFQVIFWETEQKVVASPPDALAYATSENVDACKKAMADVYAFQQTRIGPALEKALAQNPAEIVIVSGKSEFEEAFTKTVLDLWNNKPVKIHTVVLGRYAAAGPLKAVSEKTGGQFRQLAPEQFQEYLQYTPG